MSNDIEYEATGEDIARHRILLGKLATEIARDVANGEKLTQTHLELAIRELMDNQTKEAPPAAKDDDELNRLMKNVTAQMQQINEQIISLRYMIMAQAAESDDQIKVAMRQLNTRLNEKQIKVAQETNLNIPTITGLMERLNLMEQRTIEAEKTQDQEQERV